MDLLNKILTHILGYKYYANIINTRGTSKCEISCFIFHTKEEALKHGMKYRFKKGETPLQRLGEERERERVRKVHEKRNETIRRDRIRINWGFAQKTKMRLVRQPRQWRSYRYTMGKRGYIVERGSRVICYDENTNRSAFVEKNAQQAGLIIKAL